MKLLGETLLSRYTIEKVLGSGGFGDTYLARDVALPSHPPCVVKHLKPKNEASEVQSIAQSLFEREANTLYELGEYESIPRLFAHFEQNGEFFLVQEFIDGHDLSVELQPDKPLSLEAVQSLVRELLVVLSVLHQKNVIHRDVKPQNIMRRSQDNKLFLIDFGAVKEIPQLTVNDAGQTALTVAIGSPGYMPSEQAVGKPKAASDIYAVGMIAIQALTGQLPMQLPSDPHTGELLWAVPPHVSPGLALFLKRMTQDHFSQRYQNAMEALVAFEQLHEAVTTVQATPHALFDNIASGPQAVPPTEYQIPMVSASAPQAIATNSSSQKLTILPWALVLTGLLALGAGVVMMIQPWAGKIQVTSNTNQQPNESTVDIKIQRNQVESSRPKPILSKQSPVDSTPVEDIADTVTGSPQDFSDNPSVNPAPDIVPPNISSEGVAFVIDPPSNIRVVPNGEILCAVPSPQTIPILAAQGDWYPTSYCGELGVIHRSQLSFNGQQAWVIDPPSNVRSQPNGDILCAVAQASQIETYGQTNGWYRTNICAGNIIGYIHNSQITFN